MTYCQASVKLDDMLSQLFNHFLQLIKNPFPVQFKKDYKCSVVCKIYCKKRLTDYSNLLLSFYPIYLSKEAKFLVRLVGVCGGTQRHHRLQAQWKQRYIRLVVTGTLNHQIGNHPIYTMWGENMINCLLLPLKPGLAF